VPLIPTNEEVGMSRRAEYLHDLPAPRRAIGDALYLKPVTGTGSRKILIVGFHR
jgi:hypothetical protein